MAFASYFISDRLWSAFFTSKRHKPSQHVKVVVHGEGVEKVLIVVGTGRIMRTEWRNISSKKCLTHIFLGENVKEKDLRKAGKASFKKSILESERTKKSDPWR
jgi:hypothetical protein